MKISCVFNLDSVDDLQFLTKALTQATNTMREKALENHVQQLEAQREELELKVKELRKQLPSEKIQECTKEAVCESPGSTMPQSAPNLPTDARDMPSPR